MKKKISLEIKKKIYCAKNGHSNIVATDWGYVQCARCESKIGDSLLGYSNEDAVIVGHRCQICNDNAEKLTKKDKAYISKKVLNEIGA